MLTNRSRDAAAMVKLTVSALDDAGAVVGSQLAALELTTLVPGESTRFEAVLVDVFVASGIEFSVDSVALRASGSEQGPPTAAD